MSVKLPEGKLEILRIGVEQLDLIEFNYIQLKESYHRTRDLVSESGGC